MAKRFTDNEKWKKNFFKSLSTVNKLFFLYILDECDNAGIWHVEPEIASIRIGEQIDIERAKIELGKHIYEFDNGEKWFIPFFVDFQYGVLNPSVNAHKSVIDKLKKRNLTKVYEQFINCSLRDMDKDKDKDKDKDNKEKESAWQKEFKRFWLEYPKKVGKGKAEDWFRKIKPDSSLVDKMIIAIKQQKESVQWVKDNGQYIPNPATWLNQKRWEDEVIGNEKQIEYRPA